jgi:hypothetical protein
MSRVRRSIGWLGALALAAAALPGVSGAQLGRLELTPFVGAYVPASDLARASEQALGTEMAVTIRNRPAVAFGANVEGWFGPRWGIQGTAAYAPTDVRYSGSLDGESGRVSRGSAIWLFNAKLLARVTSPENRIAAYIGAGPAVVSRSGSAYDDFEGVRTEKLTDVGGVLAAAIRYPVAQGLALSIGADTYLYEAQLRSSVIGEEGAYTWDSRFQTDFVLSAGLTITRW